MILGVNMIGASINRVWGSVERSEPAKGKVIGGGAA